MAKSGGGTGRGGGFRRGEFVRVPGLPLRGFVVGRGTIGRNTPGTVINIGGGRTTVVPTAQLQRS